MSSFWPEGLSVSDVQSPYEILESAKEEWEAASEGVLTLVLQLSGTDEGNSTITVHAKNISRNRTVTLLSVIHRENAPYPAVIKPNCKALPNILKKSYYQPGVNDYENYGEEYFIGETVTNKWVSDTPSEFRNKLAEAFNLSEVKAVVLNLTSFKGTAVDTDNGKQE